jgi:hypothetical protein
VFGVSGLPIKCPLVSKGKVFPCGSASSSTVVGMMQMVDVSRLFHSQVILFLRRWSFRNVPPQEEAFIFRAT